MPRIIIIRHGNTFHADETPRRIGHTDLPLTEQGQQQIRNLSEKLFNNNIIPDIILSSPLKRAHESACIIANFFKISADILLKDDLTEMHYGPDENQTEDTIYKRIGSALDEWNKHSIIPKDWPETNEAILQRWYRLDMLCNQLLSQYHNIALVTSQGIARFAPQYYDIHETLSCRSYRLGTAHYGLLEKYSNRWMITQWNQS